MNRERTIPDAETRARNVARMRDACRRVDAVTLALDELIAMVEEHNRHSPLTLYRLAKYKGEAVEQKSQT
ncbi:MULTISPECIES: hypothetical protein [Planktothrix]|uniref:hypothetical protein n=1 Tax=Planktothrix TaxID=54304 RepID=UPI00047E6E18|nr:MULTISPECIES: hypothetical protein [Planktothrix]